MTAAALLTVMAIAAGRYAAAGLDVLPVHWLTDRSGCSCRRLDCRHPGKHPLIRNGKDGATSDLPTVKDWWNRWPAANVAIRPPAGVVVLDVDPRNGGAVALAELTAAHGNLCPTWTARTGGGGMHIWFAYGGPLRGQFTTGVDIKSHAGYVLAPPSGHVSGGSYSWLNALPVAPLPAWARRLIAPAPPPSRSRPTWGPHGSGEARDGLVRTVADAQPGGRNAALHWSACRAFERGGDGATLDAIAAAAIANGLPEREVRATIASARRAAGAGS